MHWFLILPVISVILDWFKITSLSDQEKDLEILLLRHQLAILQRQQPGPHRDIAQADKLKLTLLTVRLRAISNKTLRELRSIIRIVQPETLFRWHRYWVSRKWNHRDKRRAGRPRTRKDLELLIVQLARENPDWGYRRLHGELVKLGSKVSKSTIANILAKHGIRPAPERSSVSWAKLFSHYKDQLLACDFFSVETLFLQTIYVLFFIEVGTRRVHIAGCTSNPKHCWIEQQARQMVWQLEDENSPIHFLIHDRDSSFTKRFDDVFASVGIRRIITPARTPNANAYAERWVRSVRTECLDKLLIINEIHLRRVLREYEDYYNNSRPHQGIDQRTPNPREPAEEGLPVRSRDVLGGIIHDYYRAA